MGFSELAFTAAMTVRAYLGLSDYAWLGVGWLLPELAHSSFGCAICDPVIAVWLFLGAPSVWARRRVSAESPAGRP